MFSEDILHATMRFQDEGVSFWSFGCQTLLIKLLYYSQNQLRNKYDNASSR